MFDCNVSDKRILCFYHIVTLVISARSVLYMLVTLVISAHYVINVTMFVIYLYVSDTRTLCFGQVIVTVSNKRTPYLYFIATLVIGG